MMEHYPHRFNICLSVFAYGSEFDNSHQFHSSFSETKVVADGCNEFELNEAAFLCVVNKRMKYSLN